MANSNHKFGTTDWNEETGPRKGAARNTSNENKTQYMKLVNGSNFVRVVTEPKRYITHKFKDEGDKGFGDWVKCSMPLHNECPLCDIVTKMRKSDSKEVKDLAKANQPKKRWLVGVIDRATSQYRILDISSLIYDQIKTLNQSKWGSPTKYDLEIVMNDKAAAANFYKVLPQMPEPLSEADLAIIKTVSEEDLLKRCTPPEPAWVLSRINTLREKRGLSPLEAQVAETGKVAEEAPQVEASTPDEDLTFPAQH